LAGKTRLHRYGMERFLLAAAEQLESDGILLDAGAGDCKHKQIFSHLRVIALDVKPTRKRRYGEIDLCGDLHAIPCKTGAFDAVANVEVLEHLQEPEAALRELLRVLKPGGRLLLVVPQGWEEHSVPRDFYRYTQFGLRYLFEKVGFQVNSISPLGGYFWYMGHRIPVAYRYFFPKERKRIWKILDAPIRHPARFVLRTLVPYLCYYLDALDKRKSYTLNYGCICQKP
jgi:SAM-dependent methyltransferase